MKVTLTKPLMTQLQMSPLNIRLAIPDDYGAIAEIYNEAIANGTITMDTEPTIAEDFATTINQMGDREVAFVAELDNRVIGWGMVKRYSDRIGYQVCCETSIYLTFSETGNGYGHALQQVLMEKVKAFDYHHIVAKIVATNYGSIRFHQRFGFEVVGIQKEIGFMKGNWHDVVIMQCLL